MKCVICQGESDSADDFLRCESSSCNVIVHAGLEMPQRPCDLVARSQSGSENRKTYKAVVRISWRDACA